MKKVENFAKALGNLKEIYNYTEPYDTVTQTGMVSLFEIAFEQAWKAMKECLEMSGYDESKTGSPRAIIKLAYKSGMIDDEAAWIEMLRDRNNVAHSYSDVIAKGIIDASKNKYVTLLEMLLSELQTNWRLN